MYRFEKNKFAASRYQKKSSRSTFDPQEPFVDRFRRSTAQLASRGIGPINPIDGMSNSDRKNQALDDMRIRDLARTRIDDRSRGANTSPEGSRGGNND